MTHSFQALGTTWWIEIFSDGDEKTLNVTFGDIERFVAEFEQRYSRFNATSLITQLNQERILQNPDEHYRALLAYGKNLYLRTNTHFNLLTGHILEARGYDISYSFTPKDESDLTAGNPVTDLLISAEQIELVHGNVDIGGYGKGYLIDEVAQRLSTKHALPYFIINAGGDMYASSNQEKPVEIYLEHPTQEKTFLQKTTLFNQGFAASSPFKRQWKGVGGTTHTHIVSQHKTASVATFIKAATACEADVFATTALLAPSTEFHTLIQDEKLAVAFYHPDSGELTGNKAFFNRNDS